MVQQACHSRQVEQIRTVLQGTVYPLLRLGQKEGQVKLAGRTVYNELPDVPPCEFLVGTCLPYPTRDILQGNHHLEGCHYCHKQRHPFSQAQGFQPIAQRRCEHSRQVSTSIALHWWARTIRRQVKHRNPCQSRRPVAHLLREHFVT